MVDGAERFRTKGPEVKPRTGGRSGALKRRPKWYFTSINRSAKKVQSTLGSVKKIFFAQYLLGFMEIRDKLSRKNRDKGVLTRRRRFGRIPPNFRLDQAHNRLPDR